MRKLAVVCCGIVVAGLVVAMGADVPVTTRPSARPLPPPNVAGDMSLEQAIASRRSVREMADKRLTAAEIGQLCWAGQGVTEKSSGHRAAPSAGALYPIELYLVTPDGVDRYVAADHSLAPHRTGDHRRALQGGRGQATIAQAPLCFVITAVVDRTKSKYGERAERYCLLEAGHVAQNILLQAAALRLAGVPIGGYDEDKVAEVLHLPKGHSVLYLLPVGHPK